MINFFKKKREEIIETSRNFTILPTVSTKYIGKVRA